MLGLLVGMRVESDAVEERIGSRTMLGVRSCVVEDEGTSDMGGSRPEDAPKSAMRDGMANNISGGCGHRRRRGGTSVMQNRSTLEQHII